MGIITAMLFERFRAGKLPVTLISMDNCSQNGELLEKAVKTMAEEWEMRGFRLLCREETGDFTWATTEEMKNTYSIPTAFRKFQKLL